MSNAVALRPQATITVTDEQRELIRRTVAQGATNDELELYLYDCRRQGVHPLDKLLHFTKRRGRYVPVTSIDLLRSRAAETGELAGCDDAIFEGREGKFPAAATVTVYRLTQGQRYGYTGTARWSEYCPPPDSAQMWQKMPHTMLAKCAEALALRKGFPKQLAGLYIKEEMDQADDSGQRQNPHVNRPEDIVGEESPDERSILPDGDPKIKPLPKTATRAEFSRAQNELYQIKSVRELEEWCDKNKDRFQIFHEDHKKILRGLIRAHRETLPQIVTEQRDGYKLSTTVAGDAAPASEVPTDPEQFLKWCDAQLAAVTDPGLLEPTWTHKIEPWLDVLLPPDVEEAQGIYRKHEQRLS